MKSIPLYVALLLVAVVSLSACASSEMARINTPQWIEQNPNLQFDFTVPIYNNPIYLGVKVNVSFDGAAQFYMLRSDQPYARIKSCNLTFDEMERLTNLFEEARFASYPEMVPEYGQVSTPPSAIQMGYRPQRGRDYRTVYGAVSAKRDEPGYPDGFFDLLDGLAGFVSVQLNASASNTSAAQSQLPDRRVAAKRR